MQGSLPPAKRTLALPVCWRQHVASPPFPHRLTPAPFLLLQQQTEMDDDAYARSRTGRARVRSFAADPSLFPCEVWLLGVTDVL